MTRAGCRRGTIGQVGGGAAGVVFSAQRTVDSVVSRLSTQAAGVLCPLLGIAGIPIGLWIADGSGSAFCPSATFTGRADGTEFTVGTTSASNIEIDVGSSLSWANGLTPLATVKTKIVMHCLGDSPPSQGGSVFSRTSQTITPGTLVANEFWGAGWYLKLVASTLVTFVAKQYSAGWRARVGLAAWPSPSFSGGGVVTFDTDGDLSCLRSPKDSGTKIQSQVTGDFTGDTEGPSDAPPSTTATDAWSNVGRTSVPALFYGPESSDLAVTFENIRVTRGSATTP